MAKVFFSLVALLFVAQAQAALNASAFSKRFEIVRDPQGAAKMIVLKDGDIRFSIQPVIDDIRRDLEFAQMAQATMSPRFDYMMSAASGSDDWQDAWTPEQKEYAQKSYSALMALNIREIFENPKFKDVMKKFETKIKDHMIGHRVMANMQDSKYFYSRSVAHKLANYGFDLASKTLSTVPLVAVAVQVINNAIDNVQDRRAFHHNMLLFYFEQFTPEQLGLTKEEVAFAKSSIYEARIPWFLFPESRKAGQNWRFYGSDYFGLARSQADSTLENNMSRYDSVGERLNFAFAVVVEKGQTKIVNLVDRRFIFSPAPADAYFESAPHKIERQRRMMRLVQLGIGFVPIPGMARTMFNIFINSTYQNQEKTEGALYGYFEASERPKNAEAVLSQTLNPYLQADFDSASNPDIWNELF